MHDRTAFVTHHDCSRHDTGWKHPEHQGRLPAVARAVHRDMLTLHDRLVEVEGTPAPLEALTIAHDPAYVERVMEQVAAAAAADTPLPLENGVMVSGATGDAVRAAVGCVLTAVDGVNARSWRNAFCAVRPPGRGAGRDFADANALFNGVAVAALRASANGAGRVWVVDLAARPARGLDTLLAPADEVLPVQVTGGAREADGDGVARYLAPGADGADALRALREALDEAERRSTPALILFGTGFDALAEDPVGDLGLQPADYHALTVEVRERADRLCEGRLVSVLEEGYAPAAMGTAVVQHLRALAALPPHEG